MSGTSCEIDFITGCYDVLPNAVMSDLLYEKMAEIDDMTFTAQERAFAKELQASFPEGSVRRGFDWMKESSSAELDPAEMDDPLWERVLPHSPTPPLMGGSTEVADVSWITPTRADYNDLLAAGYARAQLADCGILRLDDWRKGMIFAAKAMALAGFDLLTEPDLLAGAKAEFEKARAGREYVSPLPPEATPK